MLWKPAITAARLKATAGFAITTLRNAKNAATAIVNPKYAEHREYAAPAHDIRDHAGNGRAEQIAGQADGEQAADGDLSLLHRHEVADERHRHRKHAARHQPGGDAHGDQDMKAGRHRADERGQPDDEQAHIHQPRLAEEIGKGAEHRLHQRIGKRIGGREQRRAVQIDQQVGRDLWNDRVDRAREQRRRKDHQVDDFQDGRDGKSR